MENEHGSVTANITLMDKTVTSVSHFTMMHHGAELHQRMCTSAKVSDTPFSFNKSSAISSMS